MAASFFRDDNTVPLHDANGGLRPDFTTISKAATGAAITELSIATLNIAANRSERSLIVIRVSVTGANACFFSLGPATTPPATSAAMITLQANGIYFFKATAQDLSAYHLQIGATSNIEICAMV